MPCYHPRNAWRFAPTCRVYMGIAPPGTEQLRVPCMRCSGCNERHALGWALRCHLEHSQHQHSAWIGLTYNDDHRPPTLSRYHLQLFLKRLRRQAAALALPRIRFFASGEYGDARKRPHYHVLAFGLPYTERLLVQNAWTSRRGSIGHISCDPLTTANICYTAGYTDKKFGDRIVAQHERIDPDTGELYYWQPPFIQMSRRPGIGGHARQWTRSWRDYGILNGTKTPVPRFLAAAWEAVATETQKIERQQQRKENALTRDTTPETLHAMEVIAHTKHKLKAQQRALP